MTDLTGQSAVAAPQGAGLRILVVEDDALLQMLMCETLTCMGHEVCAVAATEAEAVAFVVGKAVGLKVGNASADYIHLYHGNAALLTESLELVQQTAGVILAAIQPEEPAQSQDFAAVSESTHEPRRARRSRYPSTVEMDEAIAEVA